MDDYFFNGEAPDEGTPAAPAADEVNETAAGNSAPASTEIAESEASAFDETTAAENQAPAFDETAAAENKSNRDEINAAAEEILNMFRSANTGAESENKPADTPEGGFSGNASQQYTSYGQPNKNPYSQTQNPEFGGQNRFYNGQSQQPYGNAPRYGTNPGGYQGGYQGANRQYDRNPGYSTSAQYRNPNTPYGSTAASSQTYVYNPSGAAANAKPKKNAGKTIFAILVCACIIIASVAIGVALTKGGKSENLSNTPANEAFTQNEAAPVPEIEQAPQKTAAAAKTAAGAMSAEEVYEAVKDINVGVLVYSKTQKVGEGSGIIVGEDKTGTYTYILTCAHVISNSNSSVQVLFNNDTELDAEIVGFDTKTDVGVLKVKKTGFTSAKFGDSKNLKVGQTVYAIGNPGGSEFFGTFTDGKVTALDRPVATSSNSYYDLPCVQHNAAINPGNSGGALVNEFGQVIGLNSSKIADTEYEGMGFSVPINTVLEIYTDIVKNGYVTNRPMLGITYYAVSSDYTYSNIAWRNNLPYGSIVIASITQDSDLISKNVREGDIIIAVNGQELDSTDILLEAIENGKVGDTLKLTICRLTSSGAVDSKFNVNVKLIEDKGTNTVEQTEPATDDFSSFFPFGY